MNRRTKLLYAVYAGVKRSGLLESRHGRWLYRRMYWTYKRLVESPFPALTRSYPALFSGGHIIDVGAHIGFTADLFLDVVESPHRVYAFEPSPENWRQLLEWAQERCDARVVPIALAVGADAGEVALWLNPANPADHRVLSAKSRHLGGDDLQRGAPTVRIQQTSLDAFARSQGILTDVAFVKIDVQGSELQVLRGMRVLIDASPRLSIGLEYSPDLLRAHGDDPAELLAMLAARQFRAWTPGPAGLVPWDTRAPIPGGSAGYEDVVFSRRDPSRLR